MYFVVYARDHSDRQSVRVTTRPAHRAYLRCPAPHAIEVVAGGPLLDDSLQSMNGTLLIVRAESIDEVHRFVADDPYCRAGLFAHIDVRPWDWSLGAPPSGTPPTASIVTNQNSGQN